MHRGRALVLVLVALLAACSMRSALDALTSPEDRAFAETMVERLRGGDAEWLEGRFRSDLWEQSGKDALGASELYPSGEARTEIVGFQISSHNSGGATERSKEFTLVTHGGGRWTVTHFRTLSTGGPDQVVEWRVTPHDRPPPELVMIESWDKAVPWLWATMLVALLAAAGLIVWLVRRSRRRQDPLEGRGPAAR